MDELFDLSDEIGAGDWLIPNAEISSRRLIKQTSRYNIYKADWFGDVLVYEPICNDERREKKQLALRREQNYRSTSDNKEELSFRLGQLNLSMNLNQWSPVKRSQHSINGDCETDSAYSSISSTPQYTTKNITSEFEFPTRLSSPLLSSGPSFTDFDNEVSPRICAKSSSTEHSKQALTKSQSTSLVLNKDSYLNKRHNEAEGAKIRSGDEESLWSELNELRLVAHESFMLFMGASINSLEAGSESTSLVMQMYHPKAMSLYNLLHATKFTTSPVDRLFASKQQRHHLGIEAKFNICQQVTNAMTYLHDKNIVHGKLTSVNIYIELNQRVKISLIDNEETPVVEAKSAGNSMQFNLPSLTYLSPELIQTINVSGTNQNDVLIERLTKESDIFSFGTFLFELFEERFPFADFHCASTLKCSQNSPVISSPRIRYSPLDSAFDLMLTKWNGNIQTSACELIYQIGTGQIGSKNLDKFSAKQPSLVKSIISACWSMQPNSRPQFKQLAFS